ncbi:hypothetical protein [Paenibacillus alba]|uniref:Coil containing protein n=1 Tax=Paenibacillus alba TaxID=1197127 RepID=A0ABU6FZ73_9BACL|nr:hypothetical protein [Paenibacillus alba]MEC0225928.1 hypothetical protein [Paenibacillus alba]
MTEEQIQEIIEKNGYYTSYGDGPEWVVYDDVDKLIAEVRRLQQQNKQLIEALEHYAEWVDWEDDSMGDKARIALQQIQGNT